MALVAFYTLLLVLGVFLGSRLDRLVTLTHTRTQMLMSLISGLLLGIAVFHLLPHAVYSSSLSIDHLARYLMLGLLTMFFLQRLFQFHRHEYDDAGETPPHAHNHQQQPALGRAGLGVVIGLSIHSVIDGVALAFSIYADTVLGGGALAALGVFLAIFLHKPLDALTLSFFMREKGFSARRQLLLLLTYALICPIVVVLVLFSGFGNNIPPSLISAVLAFSAGIFLCIALSDLLPEIHFHDHDRGKMTLMLLIGIGLSLLLGMVESDHRHEEDPFKEIKHLDQRHHDNHGVGHNHQHN